MRAPARARTPGGERHLLQTPAVGIGDWSCLGHDEGAREEWSDSYQVVVVRRGAFVREVEGRAVFGDASVAMFWHAGETYRVRHPVPGGDLCSVFRVPADGIRELLGGDGRAVEESAEPRFPAARVVLDGRAYLLHALAVRGAARAADAADPLEVEELGVAFLQAAVGAAASGGAGSRRLGAEHRNPRAAEYAARVREVLAARFRERLSLAEIGRLVHCSPYHLSRLVVAAEGVAIHRLQLRLRLREALQRILDGDRHLLALALGLGFASHSHFTESFRREFGHPPSAVRRLSARTLAGLSGPRRGG